MANLFNGLLVSEKDGKFEREIRTMNFDDLPHNEILVKVAYSSLNYKDALSASGNKGITRKFPHIPGIDAAGTVAKSSNAEYKVGAQVIVTGFDLGMNTWGGFGEYVSVPATWLVPLPPALTAREAMSFGTAGLTAGLSVEKIIGAGIKPQDGPIVVSGATGGVGSMATAILATLGYAVTAISGKKEDGFLTSVLGAVEVLGREEFTDKYNSKPLSVAEFSAGIDNVGGAILSGILKSVKQNGVVTCCGNVSSTEINTSIFPFILRGITLAGIDSAQAPIGLRKKVWEALATEWKPAKLDLMIQEIGLDTLAAKLDELLAGKAKGRYILKHH